MLARSRLRPVLLLLLFALAVPVSVHATSLAEMNLEEMAALSPSVVHGTVTSAVSRWNADRTLIQTEVSLRVQDVLKGGSSGEISFLQPGGRVGKLMVEVPGAAAYRPGEEVVLFLAPDPAGRLRVVGLNAGRFDVTRDERTGEKLIAGLAPERLRRLESANARPGRLEASPGGTVSLDRFLGRVRNAVRDAIREGGN